MGEHEIPAEATKEIFFAPFRADFWAVNGAQIDAPGEICVIMLLVPQDFTAITAIELLIRPLETNADNHIGVHTAYGNYNGETYNTHTEDDANRDIGATVANQNLAHDISDLVDVAALAAGDLLMVYCIFSAVVVNTNMIIRGVRLKYT